jgi:hypothetical protein
MAFPMETMYSNPDVFNHRNAKKGPECQPNEHTVNQNLPMAIVSRWSLSANLSAGLATED